MEKAHSRIGASSCERWWNCPGSVREVAMMPPQKTSIFAAEGTAAHTIGERCLITGVDATSYAGTTLEVDGYQIEITDEMCEAVQLYLDTIRTDMEMYQVHISDLQVEHKFHLDFIDPDAFGTNDCNIVIFGQKVIVYDYKHGSGVAVDAEDNKQGLFYALGAIQGHEVTEIEVVIVQPRAFHADGPVRRWAVTLEQLNQFAEDLKMRIEETKRPDAPLRSGDHCKKTFCAAMASCPAVRKTVENAAMTVFSEQPVGKLPDPSALTKVMLRRILEAMPMMDQWLRSVEAYAEAKANAGEEILGFKLVRGREGNRKWADEDIASGMLSDLMPEDKMFERKLMSPTKIEKILGKEHKKQIDSLITRSEGKIILVSEDDPREAVSPSAVQAFQDKLE